MVSTISEFQQEIAWDRVILERIVELTKLSSRGENLDLRTNSVTLDGGAGIGSGESRVQALKNKILPLAFGAAWKIIDVAAELALVQAGQTPRNPRRWTIDEKVRQVLTNPTLALPGFATQHDLLRALWGTYASTTELRHSLVHRKVSVDGSGAVVGVSAGVQNQVATAPMTLEEQTAFSRAAMRLVDIVSRQMLSGREEADLRTQLTRLAAHHTAQLVPVQALHEPIRVSADFPKDAKLNLPEFRSKIAKTFPSHVYIDLELTLDETRTIVVELDQAPDEIVELDLLQLPGWARYA